MSRIILIFILIGWSFHSVQAADSSSSVCLVKSNKPLSFCEHCNCPNDYSCCWSCCSGGCENNTIAAIQKATTSVRLATSASLTDPVLDALVKATHRKVNVRVMLEQNQPDAYLTLKKNGIPVRICSNTVGLRNVIIDGKIPSVEKAPESITGETVGRLMSTNSADHSKANEDDIKQWEKRWKASK